MSVPSDELIESVALWIMSVTEESPERFVPPMSRPLLSDCELPSVSVLALSLCRLTPSLPASPLWSASWLPWVWLDESWLLLSLLNMSERRLAILLLLEVNDRG